MKRIYAFALMPLFVTACGGGEGSSGSGGSVAPPQPNPPVTSSARKYNGTASVGDFLNITVDPSAKTIAYTNKSNGDSGTVSYTVNSDGSYAIADPTGNLVTAYEIPNYGMIVQANKTGPDHNTQALITAIETAPISLATWGSRAYNFMQFRTTAGGVEVGSVTVDAGGNMAISAYWPFGALAVNSTGFNNVTKSVSSVSADSSGSFLTVGSGPGETDYVFGTSNGLFAVDTNNGAILGLQKAAGKAFDASFAGTYNMLYYLKNTATVSGNSELGNVQMGKAAITVSAQGDVTVKDAQQNTLLIGTLVPVADAAYLHGPNGLNDLCNGLFTLRVLTANSQQDVFVAFQDHTVLFESFQGPLPLHQGGTYSYVYGVGMR